MQRILKLFSEILHFSVEFIPQVWDCLLVASRQHQQPTRTNMNEFKTTDIRIHKDSVGCYTATHKFQGILIDGSFYNNREECRREAVRVLKELKDQAA